MSKTKSQTGILLIRLFQLKEFKMQDGQYIISNDLLTIILLISIIIGSSELTSQTSIGSIQANTNPALPSSYNLQEYVFAEPDDEGACNGAMNSTATIDEVFFAQTHRHAIDHPFFFTIGHRPVLMQVALKGSGISPDVKVEGFMDGLSIGVKCLKGPETLTENLDLNVPNFDDYFTVTLPKSWIQQGLSLSITVGDEVRDFSTEELKIGPLTELNLVLVNMDVLDYNTDPHQTPIINNFLQEVASAFPASVVRFGVFPEPLVFPEIIANNDTEQLARLKSKYDKEPNGITSDGSINSITSLFLSNLHRSTGDYLSTFYFGNTLNLAPGGWGGGKSFVSFDYDDVFVHELGHAFSLPHWGESAYDIENPNEYEYLYPYGGANDDGGGRGESWNFIQDIYEFIDPICQYDERGVAGLETSDAMQRNNHCLEQRSVGQGPWDGFGDFSALAMHRYLVGDENVKTGSVAYKDEMKDFQFRMNQGFPAMTLENEQRIYTRDESQPQDVFIFEEFVKLPGEEKLNQDVYLIYGTAHETQTQANIVYRPIRFNGTLPPVIDMTDPETFNAMKAEKYRDLYTRDITLKLYYEDGSILHVTNPFHSYQRSPYTWGYHIWRDDICNFSLVVPGDKQLMKVELYKRPFVVGNIDDPLEGNINDSAQGITAENFMESASYMAEYDFSGSRVLGKNSIGKRVWNDLNQNGRDDFDEPGIEGVKILLWGDSNQDGIPDSEAFMGITTTNENGQYLFAGLEPGKYLVFVWFVDNWDQDGPLFGMTPVEGHTDPNNDINGDNNGRPGNLEFPGLSELDIASGIIELTTDGEPLNDGDREDDWFDYDPSGNMTVDFGFYFEGGCPKLDLEISGLLFLCDEELGSIKVAAASGEAPYSYIWNTGDTNSELVDLGIGEYIVTVTDNKGCASIETISIEQSPAIEIVISGSDSLCIGEFGHLDVAVTGGVAPFSLAWEPNTTDVLAGEYSITVTDDNGCAETTTYQIIEKSEAECMSSFVDDIASISIEITPNPFLNNITISNQNERNFTLELFSMDGVRLIQSKLKANIEVINLETLNSGMYIAILKGEEGEVVHVEKLVKF